MSYTFLGPDLNDVEYWLSPEDDPYDCPTRTHAIVDMSITYYNMLLEVIDGARVLNKPRPQIVRMLPICGGLHRGQYTGLTPRDGNDNGNDLLDMFGPAAGKRNDHDMSWPVDDEATVYRARDLVGGLPRPTYEC